MYHKLRIILENHWYNKNKNYFVNIILHIFLLPFSILFFLVVKIRYYLYKFNVFKVYKLPIPVVVVGNISVGGVGKTPLTLHLVNLLLNKGIKVGVILRGYKGSINQPTICYKNSDVKLVGDEALIYAEVDIPICIFKDRYQAGLKLIETYPNLDMIIMDDGLQHYKVFKDYEIIVIDTTRYFGNKFVLPNGPLREPINRIKDADVLVLNCQDNCKSDVIIDFNVAKVYQMLQLKSIYNPILDCYYEIEYLNKLSITVMVATGNPHRFYQFLLQNNIKVSQYLFFPDHHYYLFDDIPNDSDIILVTTKDYTKLKQYNNNKICVVNSEVLLDSSKLINDLLQLVVN